MIAKNAEETIDESLRSLEDFHEVVLYLNDSSDKTEDIAQRYTNVTIEKGDFIGFGDTKNVALTYSKHDWVLSLDSDEVLNAALLREIDTMDLSDSAVVYELKRDNYFLGEKTQSSDVIVRIFNRQYTQFNDNRVHEKVMVPANTKIIRLKTHFIHLNITNINQTLTKIIQYTDLGAKDKQTCFFMVIIFKALFAFFKTYILQGNILKGWVGFALAINSANKRYYKYLKQFINCKTARKK
jgi:glycosyltransferase involved in cell wall biosynthesis